MDRLDRQIIQCLRYNGRAPFRRIAEVLEVSEQTVARRFRTLHSRGTLRVTVVRDPRAAGRQVWSVRMQCRPDTALELGTLLAERDDASWVTLMAGGSELMCSTSAALDDPRGSVLLHRLPRTGGVLSLSAHAVLRTYAGGSVEWVGFEDPLRPDQLDALLPEVRPSATPPAPDRDDDLLLAHLARDGRLTVAALAAATGLPAARVSSRLDALLTSGAAYVDVDLGPRSLHFHSEATLWLTVEPGEIVTVCETLAAHRESAYVAAVTGTANVMASIMCRNPEELYSYVTARVGALVGVRQMEIVPVLRRLKHAVARVEGDRLRITA